EGGGGGGPSRCSRRRPRSWPLGVHCHSARPPLLSYFVSRQDTWVMVPEKPKGSWIEEQITPDAYILKWRLPSLVWPLKVKDVLLGFLLLGSMGALFGHSIFGWDWTGILWGMLLVVSPLLVLFLMMGLMSFRRGRPEVLTLGADSFRHDLGRPRGWLANYD